MIPYYMVGKLAPNPTRSTRGTVKHVPGRSNFRAVPSQNGDETITSPPLQSLNGSRAEIQPKEKAMISHVKLVEPWEYDLPTKVPANSYIGEVESGGPAVPVFTIVYVDYMTL